MVVCPVCRASYPEGTSVCSTDGSALLPEEAFAAAAEPRIEPGTMIGEYRVERKLGEGSFGAVYAGVQPLIGKRVAIKVLHKRMSSEPEVVARFIGEARAVNRIGHRNIIDVFSFGIHAESQHYFVMELCDGLTLAELLERETRLDVQKALPILRGIADGLDAAHAAGVTHRDLKPDNVFLVAQKSGTYFPKLLDFGVAKLLSEDKAQKTATGIAIGTPRYMSPEQSRGKKVDHRADVYALGVVTFEMLTGKHLFEADSTVDLLFKHATEEPPSMSSVAPDLPPELDAPVLAMLAKKPAARPISAGAAITALEEKVREIASAATAAIKTPPALAALEAPAEEPKKKEEPAAAPAVPEVASEKKPSRADTLVSPSAATGTGTLAIPVSPKGTLLGEPIVLPNEPQAEAAAVKAIAPAPAPRERRGVTRALVLGALALVGLSITALALRRESSLGVDERHSAPSAAASVVDAPRPSALPASLTTAESVPSAASPSVASAASPASAPASANAPPTKIPTKRKLNSALLAP